MTNLDYAAVSAAIYPEPPAAHNVFTRPFPSLTSLMASDEDLACPKRKSTQAAMSPALPTPPLRVRQTRRTTRKQQQV